MALECELKYLNVDFKKLRNALRELGAESSGPYFETNLVFDTRERSLRESNILLRLRQKRSDVLLTVKRPPEVMIDSMLKVVEELETTVDDFDSMLAILDTLGFFISFSYEKVREKWRFMRCAICLDELPFGSFVEIEGEEHDIFQVSKLLGIQDSKTSKQTYHALNVAYRKQNGLADEESFVFTKEQKEAIDKQIGKD